MALAFKLPTFSNCSKKYLAVCLVWCKARSPYAGLRFELSYVVGEGFLQRTMDLFQKAARPIGTSR